MKEMLVKEFNEMRTALKKLFAVVLTLMMVFGGVAEYVSAAPSSKLQFYFSPQMMNDVSGEVTIDINMRDFGIAVPKSLGDICSFTFAFTFDDEHFTLGTDENGGALILLDDKTLVKAAADIETTVDGNRISVHFMDSTLKDRLIHGDGILLRFKLTAKNVRDVWNSANLYPLRFVPGSIGVVTYNLADYSVGRCYDVEGIDGRVGGYTPTQPINPALVKKRFEFEQGSKEMTVNSGKIDMDVTPIEYEDKTMLPIRFLAENAGMTVEWDNEAETASAYAECRTMKIFIKNGKVYLNSALLETDAAPFEADGRVYISTETVKQLWKGASVTQDGGRTVVDLP